MALIVQKYGGTSVGSTDRMKNVAKRVLATQKQGHDVAVVVSAMSGETNRLVDLIKQITDRPDEREVDVVLATGEQVSIGLVALAIQTEGGKAKSFLGDQCRIVTDSTFSKARIKSIDAEHMHKALKAGNIAVIAGFQGVDEDGNVTTLGRGGSDTTAVAIAAALKADACEIYTDVDGVYTTDPGICPEAKKLDKISYEEMLELASLGAKVLQIRSVELAMNHKVPLWVKSSFSDDPGTLVCEEDESMEDVVVNGVALDRNEAKISLLGIPDAPGVASKLFGALDDKAIVVDLIVQNPPRDGKLDLTFTVGKADLIKATDVVKGVAKSLKAASVETSGDIAKVSIVGVGMRNHSGVASRMFDVLAKERINLQAISTSEIRVSCLIESKYAELAVRALHTAFGLDAKGGSKPAQQAQEVRRLGVAVLLLAVLAVGALLVLRWPSQQSALDCPPSQVHLDDAGIARCGDGRPLSAEQVLTAGGKLDLNRATADELAVIPGVGPKLAKTLVDERTRLGGFKSWDEVDRVSGVGDSRLSTLRSAAEIR